MKIEIPVRKHFISGGGWHTTELKHLICDDVSIEKLEVGRKIVPRRKKADLVKVNFTVDTYTLPTHDRNAFIKFYFKNDNETIDFRSPKRGSAPILKINAEEGKRRRKAIDLTADWVDFQEVLKGPNPRLVIEVTIEDN